MTSFESKVLRTVFESQREEVRGGWRNAYKIFAGKLEGKRPL
jgi:hypothetical protein